MLYLTVVSLGLHALFSLLAQGLSLESLELMWILLARRIGVDPMWIRLIIYGGLQFGVYALLRGPLSMVLGWGERVFTHIQELYLKFGELAPRFRRVFGFFFSLMVTLLLIPFVVQPTLVPLRLNMKTVAQRITNLVDGQATMGFADSVVGFYRRLYAEPEPIEGVPARKLDEYFEQTDDDGGGGGGGDMGLTTPKEDGEQPLMDRWDPYIVKATAGEDEGFAYVKAFMWVESAGRQFAVSRTGCLGLMQFCAGTARSKPFSEVFGTGQVYVCQCEGPCKIPRDVQSDLERGDKKLLEKHAPKIPCELTDARFNGPKAIRAGALYVERLRASFGGNIYLMYIGYNSGPAVAGKVWRATGKNPDVTLAEIEIHLADAIRPWQGDAADARARGLVHTHLPKIKRAYDRYYQSRQDTAQACLAPREVEDAAPMMREDTPPEVAALLEDLERSKAAL